MGNNVSWKSVATIKRITGKSGHAARSHILIDARLTLQCRSSAAVTWDRRARWVPPASSDPQAIGDPSCSAACAHLPGGEPDRLMAASARRALSSRARSYSPRCASHATPPQSRHSRQPWLPQPQKTPLTLVKIAALRCARESSSIIPELTMPRYRWEPHHLLRHQT